MSKTLRRLVRVIGAIVLVFVVVLAAVRFFVPADKLAGIIAQRIEVATGGTAGFVSAEVDVWPSLRLVLSDGAVVGTGAALTARTGTEVDVESYAARFRRLEVSLAWGPLLSRRLEVGKVHLVEPDIELVTRVEAAEPAAFGGPGTSGETADALSTAPVPVALFVAGLEVSNGRILWRDASLGRQIRIEGWHQNVSIGDATLLLERLSAFAGNRPYPSSDPEPSRLDLRSRIASLSLEGFSGAGTQVFNDLDLTGTIEIPPAADGLLLKLRHLTWNGLTVTATGSVARTMIGERLLGEWCLTGLDLDALRRGLPEVTPQLTPELTAWLADAPLSVDDVQAAGAFDLPWPLPQGARYRDLAAGISAQIEVRDLETIPPEQTIPWRGSAKLDLAGAAAELQDVRLVVGDGHIDGAAQFGDLDQEHALCSFTLICRDVPARTILDAVAPMASPYVEGNADLEMAGNLVLGSAEDMRDSLGLAGDVALSDGIIHASSWLDEITPYLGDRQDLKNIRFRHLVHKLYVRDGKVIIDGLVLDGHDTDWRGDGWLGLNGGIDMSLNVKFPTGFEPDLGNLTMLAEALRGDDGRIALNLIMTGRASSPNVMLDMAPAKDRLSEQIENGVKGFLDKLRGNK